MTWSRRTSAGRWIAWMCKAASLEFVIPGAVEKSALRHTSPRHCHPERSRGICGCLLRCRLEQDGRADLSCVSWVHRRPRSRVETTADPSTPLRYPQDDRLISWVNGGGRAEVRGIPPKQSLDGAPGLRHTSPRHCHPERSRGICGCLLRCRLEQDGRADLSCVSWVHRRPRSRVETTADPSTPLRFAQDDRLVERVNGSGRVEVRGIPPKQSLDGAPGGLLARRSLWAFGRRWRGNCRSFRPLKKARGLSG